MPNKLYLALILLVCQFISHPAWATCSRVLQVPVAPIGLSVFVKGNEVGGVYPEVLRSLERSNCLFAFSIVPRARLEAMFEAGKADLLIPATKTPKRDEHGIFVPLVHSRAVVINSNSAAIKINKIADLLANKQLRIALVRGFDYGPVYQELLINLEKQGRLAYETDALAIGRLMQAGLVDITIMAPSIFVGAIEGDPRCQSLVAKLQFIALDEFPWGESGAYLSRKSVSKADQQALQELLQNSVQNGEVWKAFQHYYRPEVLSGSIRPIATK